MAIYTRELNYLFSKLPHGHILPLEKVLYYLHLWTSYLYLKTFKLVFPILLFSSISLYWLLRKAFLSLLAILWSSAFKWICISFYPLPFTSLLFSAIYKASSDNHFAFLNFFFLRIILITASCTMSWTSVHSSLGILSYLIPWICLPLPLYNCSV